MLCMIKNLPLNAVGAPVPGCQQKNPTIMQIQCVAVTFGTDVTNVTFVTLYMYNRKASHPPSPR